MQLLEEFQTRKSLNKAVWEKMADVTLDLFCTLDINGFYTHVNAASLGMTGFETWELEGRHFTELLHPEDRLDTEQDLRAIFNGFKRRDLQNRLICKDGSEVRILWSVVWSEEEGVMFCVGRDITGLVVSSLQQDEIEKEYRNEPDQNLIKGYASACFQHDLSPVLEKPSKTTQEIELSELAKDLHRKNSDLQQFTYIVSHNLRTPVANAIGLANLLAGADRTSATFDKSLSFLRLSLYRMDTVLRDMNTILSVRDRRGNIEREQVNFKEVILQAMSALEGQLREAGATINLDITDGLEVKVNKAYLYSIVSNLLSNSIKYRADGRRLEINIKCRKKPAGGVDATFSDNGSGFDLQKNRENVFRLYKRFHTQTEGRGMGLFLIKSHLDSMGGSIEVSSQEGRGTSFLINLPTN
ncbi:PAS domain-containing sensor histidine kinase [Rufibacter tibetensis]|uniref:histidine kinase n=1 Tax=Rufibacter tibetensis TaxID=512763 RepID=A0A0N7HX30_9BACT|nr:PAS domain-containing sensor histidine kinase [Rufibacter tibetensis]ALJ00905.1 hypothetical protein DC20_20325 [Rufibacter tibetensis]